MTNDVINKVLYDVDQRADTTDAEKKTARDNIGAAAAGDVASIDRTDIQGNTIDVDELHFKQKGVSTAQILAGSTDLGSTVPLPSMASEEGKVPVAYFRDGRGYYLLERVLPNHSAADENKVLSVQSDNSLRWVSLPAPPKVVSNQALTQVEDDGTTSTWETDLIASPSGKWAWMEYTLYVNDNGAGVFDCTTKWNVKLNGSNWTTGIFGNFSTYICGIPATGGVKFTVSVPSGASVRISYVIHQEYV